MAITVQDTYLTDYAQGFPGMLADGNTQSRPTGINNDSSATPFGAAVFSTGTGRQVTKTPGTKFRGIVIADIGVVPGLNGTPDAHAQYSSMSLCDQGAVWVTVGANVTRDAAVYVTPGGVFTASSSGNTAIPATFMDAASSGANVKIRVVQQ